MPVKKLPAPAASFPQKKGVAPKAPIQRKPIPQRAKPSTKTAPTWELPDALSEPAENLEQYTMLVFGERKIGKTTLFARYPDPFFLFFEPGGKALRLKSRYMESWEDFLHAISLLEKNPGYCKTVIIDTGFMCYERCFEYCKKKLGLEDIRDEAWGGGWKVIDAEFRAAHERLFALGLSFQVTAHTEIKHFKKKDGTEYDKLTTQLGGQATRFYNGIVDIISYYQYGNGGRRVLTIRGSDHVEAGSRVEGHFKFADGSPIDDIPMGNSPEEAFRNLQLAFDNKLIAKGGPAKKVPTP
jgi:hypothetical protein